MLKSYLVERPILNFDMIVEDYFSQMVQKSNELIRYLDSKIEWQQSYITDGKMYCVYVAESEEILRQHSRMGGFPLDNVLEIKKVLYPKIDAVKTIPYSSHVNRAANMSPH